MMTKTESLLRGIKRLREEKCLVCRKTEKWASESLCRQCWKGLRRTHSLLTVHICDWGRFPEADLRDWDWSVEQQCLVRTQTLKTGLLGRNPLRLLLLERAHSLPRGGQK